MYENEWANGREAFTPVDLMDMLHRALFAKTQAGQKLNVMERSVQKSLVDALITAAAESEGVKINKSLADEGLHGTRPLLQRRQLCGEDDELLATSRPRTVDLTMQQVSRTSDAISVKRGELQRIMQLLSQRRHTGDTATQMHYADLVLRIQTALGLQK